MNKRILNVVLCLVSFVLVVTLPIRNLLFTDVPDNARGEGATMASYIMPFLFGSLTVVFALRAIKGGKPKGA